MPQFQFFAVAVLAICLGAVGPASAQTPIPANAPVVASGSESRTDPRIERIRIEDSGARVEELRVGGETRSITVVPKGGLPAYEVIPASANRNPAATDRTSTSASGGTRVWNVFGF